MEKQIYLNPTQIPFSKRRTKILRRTILFYVPFIFLIGFFNELWTLSYVLFGIISLSVLFALEYSRQLAYNTNILLSIELKINGVQVRYYEQDELRSISISLEKFNVTKRPFYDSKSPQYIRIKNGEDIVAFFYVSENLDKNEIETLYKDLVELKQPSPNTGQWRKPDDSTSKSNLK